MLGVGAVSATLLATWPGLGEQGESCAPLQEDASILTGCLTTFTFKVLRQMSGQVSRGSAGEYQADEQAGVAGLSWRVSG